MNTFCVQGIQQLVQQFISSAFRFKSNVNCSTCLLHLQWNITKVFNGLGRSYKLSSGGDNTTQENRSWSPVRLSAAENTVDYSLQQAVIQSVNDQSSGWKNVRSKPSNTSKLGMYYCTTCVSQLFVIGLKDSGFMMSSLLLSFQVIK